MSRPRKRSLTLKGHRTSVSLEDAFWSAFREIAAEKNRPINDLAADIDADRGTSMGLASAIRLYVLAELQSRLIRQSDTLNQQPDAADPGGQPRR